MFKKFCSFFSSIFHAMFEDPAEVYLSNAVDLSDYEHRQRNIQRGYFCDGHLSANRMNFLYRGF